MSNTNNQEITLQQAIDMTTLYRANRPSNFPIAETFDRSAIENVLAVPGCVSLRIYPGMKTTAMTNFIIVAVDSTGEDILPANQEAVTDDPPVIIEDGYTCPPSCPKNSPLAGN